MRSIYGRERDCAATDSDEIRALMGMLYLAGIYKMSHVNAKDLWSTDGMAPEMFRCVMPYKRFYLLLRALRFDNIDTRQDRAITDKLAPIRQLWEDFNFKSQEAYVPSEYFTIDEMMSSFRGRCSFKQYIPSKPNRYGLKSFALSDARTFHVVKLELYAGKQPPGPYEADNKPASIVKRITQPILNTGRNITMDNWFVSIPVIQELLEKYNTTVVGTIRKNKPDLPREFVIAKKRAVNTSMFGFCDDLTLVSYVPKKNKCVLMVSSMHQSSTIDVETGDKKKNRRL
ncbi:piggyBac transposable element-derived protein 3-like [Athalia rosae]|uniref:piggyBac transposable element-derived protein 3-like n=1 Tax=Athalia rosae TaxID=37344 RepID=UPI002033BF9C|nr:piggyBac transposable element-derived protein 3-like [Athalia rosae]